jgi:hypothetical protein
MERLTADGIKVQKGLAGFKILFVLGLLIAALACPAAESVASIPKIQVEWSQGEPFVGATDGSTTATHGYQKLDDAQPATAMLPPSSGLSLVEADRGADGYRFRFDEARLRYFVKVFGPEGRVLRIYVIYPDQAEISIPYAKLPVGPVYLSVHNEAGHPLQNFKLAFLTEAIGATDTLAGIASVNGI